MERIYKRIIAFVCTAALVVSALWIQPSSVRAATALNDNEWITVGSWNLLAGTWAGATASYEGDGNGFGNMTLTITSPVTSPDVGDNKYGIQMGYDVPDLVDGVTYDYTMVINSTTTGFLFTQVPGVKVSEDISISPGDNTIKGTFTASNNEANNPAHGNIMIFPYKLPADSVLKMVSLTITKHSSEETTTLPSGEAEWVELAEETPGIADGATYSYDKTNMTISGIANIQQPAWAGQKGIYMYVPTDISAVSVNGVTENVATIEGAGAVVFLSAFTQDINEVVITHQSGTSKVTIKKAASGTVEPTTSEPTTVPEIVDGTELLKDTAFEEGNVSHWDEYGPTKYTNQGNGQLDVQVPAYDSGDNWATQLVQKNIQLYEGKWYVAEFTITSDVDKSFQFLIQSDGNDGGDWTVFTQEIVSVAAGETKKVQVQFQATKNTEENVLYGIMMGYVNGTASAAANVTIKDVSLKVYNDEQQISGSQTVLLTSEDVSVTGFQMKTNWSDEDAQKNEIGFRTVCKAPNVGGKVAVGNITYTVARIGTLYTIEPDKNTPEGVLFTASGMLLKSYNLDTNKAETVNPFTLAVTATEENGIMEKDDTYSSYVQTMIGTIGQLHPGNKIHVRAFVVTTGGTIIYGKQSVSTSMARVASYMYQQSLASNYRGHEYLYQKILNTETFVPTQNTDYITTKANPYYRNTTVVYGWNDNLYTPDDEHHTNLKPDIYLENDYLTATTGWSGDPVSVNTNTQGGVISISGVKYDYGIATNASGYFEYNVPEKAKYFVGIVGVDDSVKENPDYLKGATITCEISFDGTVAASTETLGYGTSKYIKVPVPAGASKITIKFGDAGDGNTCDRAVMANAGWMTD